MQAKKLFVRIGQGHLESIELHSNNRIEADGSDGLAYLQVAKKLLHKILGFQRHWNDENTSRLSVDKRSFSICP
jgi:hypothetical protein